MAVQEHDKRHGRTVRIPLPVCQDLRYIEHLQAADDRSDQCVGKDRPDQRKRDIEESLDARTSVQLARLKYILADPHDRRHEHDRRISKPHQEVHKSHE